MTKGGNGEVPPASEALGLAFAGAPAPPFDADVVVVNQGTNDAAATPSDEEIRAKYLEFLRRVRGRYPRAFIVALEPFGLAGALNRSGPISAAVSDLGDRRAAFVPTRGWLGPGDFTETLHPNDAGHRRATTRLVEAIARLTGLEPV